LNIVATEWKYADVLYVIPSESVLSRLIHHSCRKLLPKTESV